MIGTPIAWKSDEGVVKMELPTHIFLEAQQKCLKKFNAGLFDLETL